MTPRDSRPYEEENNPLFLVSFGTPSPSRLRACQSGWRARVRVRVCARTHLLGHALNTEVGIVLFSAPVRASVTWVLRARVHTHMARDSVRCRPNRSAHSTLARQTHLLWTRQISRPGSLPACHSQRRACRQRHRRDIESRRCITPQTSAPAAEHLLKAKGDREDKQRELRTPVQHSSVMAAATRAALSMIEPIFSTFESSAQATSLGLLSRGSMHW
jgi:hypothetical protein